MNSVGVYIGAFHLLSKLKIYIRKVLDIHRTTDLVECSIQTANWRYMGLVLQDRTFLGEGVLFLGEDSHLYVRYTVNKVAGSD